MYFESGGTIIDVKSAATAAIHTTTFSLIKLNAFTRNPLLL